jgi:hypothetical protein
VSTIVLLAIGIAIFVVPALLVGYWLLTAPVGYQDESGFHYGEQKK